MILRLSITAALWCLARYVTLKYLVSIDNRKLGNKQIEIALSCNGCLGYKNALQG